jgi:hypothetical protein
MNPFPSHGGEVSLTDVDGATRRMFYRLVNVRETPALFPSALEWVRRRLSDVSVELQPDTPDAVLVSSPAAEPARPPSEHPLSLAFHAPLALLEGAWLQGVAQASTGHLDAVAELFAGYLCLHGRNEAASPVAAFRGALLRTGISLPPVTAWRFALDERVGVPALAFAGLHLALGLHPRVLFPELLGFTLAYAQSASPWRLCALPAECRRLVLKRFDEHAGRALQAHLGIQEGEELQRRWSRVQRGYGLYRQAESEYLAGMGARRSKESTPAGCVAEIFRRKARIARGYHPGVMVGGRSLSDWFAREPFDAVAFLRAFAGSSYAAGAAGARPFDRLTGFGGAMFGVFDEEELRAIAAWLDGDRAERDSCWADFGRLTAVDDPNPAPNRSVPARSRFRTKNGGRRGLFHRLINADLFPEVADTARQYVEAELAKAGRALHSSGPLQKRFFTYTSEAFAERIVRIHDQEVARYRPFSPPAKLRREEYIWGIRQFAPAILVDGCWLQHMGEAACQDDRVHRLLYRIYADELGAGETRRNHPNVYRDLLSGLAIDLPPHDSEAFAAHPEFLDAAFDLPNFLLGISLFPRSFMPEILGLNLAIELSGLGAGYMRLIDELRYWGIDPLIVSLHLSIDNLASGHAALAAEAVQLFLDDIGSTAGEAAVDLHWRRIWRGYVSLHTVTGHFKWALALEFCRRFVPGRICRVLGFSQPRGPAGSSA